MTELVHLTTAGGVATITLDSPHNKNALSQQLTGELLERLESAGADDTVRVIVLRSALDVWWMFSGRSWPIRSRWWRGWRGRCARVGSGSWRRLT